MLLNSGRRVIGVIAINSPDYVNQVLQALERGDVVVPLRSADDSERKQIAGIRDVLSPTAGYGWFTPVFSPKSPEIPALLAFTSGTEGRPKGVMLHHGSLSDVIERLNDAMQLDDSIREYIGVPVYHSFGFGRCRAVAAVGGKAYLPENGFNPVEIAEMLRQGSINAISAVPSLWRALLDARDLFAGLGSGVRWIEIGSQYMSRAEKNALVSLFPEARIVQHYGLTEASRSTLLTIQRDADDLESVGRAVGKVEIKINDDGCIMVRGPHVAQTVIINGEPKDPRDPDGWLLTSDLGRIEDGVLYYQGRADDVINCGGLKLSPDNLELAMRSALPGPLDFAVARIPDAIRGDAILLACTPASAPRSSELLNALVREAERLGVHARGAIRVVEVAEIPRTATGKVQRKLLAELPSTALPTAPLHAVHSNVSIVEGELTSKERELLDIWKEILGTQDISLQDSFYDLGGDSVTALTVVVRMSRAGIDMAVCRRIFRGATIKELAATIDPSTGATSAPKTGEKASVAYLSTLMVNALRGLLVLSVVLGHWSPGAIERLPFLEPLKPFLSSFFSFGTPGFAIAFGLGYGYLYLAKFSENPSRMRNTARLATMMIAAGVMVLAILRPLSGEVSADSNVFVHFYSALTFYLLAVPTMPLWFSLISRAREDRRISVALACSVGLFILSVVLRDVIGPKQPDGFLRLVRLMAVAKYNYFSMMSGTMAGVAVGYFVRTRSTLPGALSKLAWAGVCAFATALGIATYLGETHLLTEWPAPLTGWKWLMYFGVIQMLMAGLLRLRDGYTTRRKGARRVVEAFATVGQLALPFFVFHEAIVPLTRVLRRVGAGGGIATAISLGLFAVGTWAMVRKVHQFFHSE